MNKNPLVSIGIPTYNRAFRLKRSVESVLIQDYTNIEIVISDNASTDETSELCKKFCKQDKRIHYIRQSFNQGAAVNFCEVLKNSKGDFFMWLGDDDYLSQSYISECVKILIEHPDYSLVCGKAVYFCDDKFLYEGQKINLLQDTGIDRVIAYYSQVSENGIFYGIFPRKLLLQLPVFQTMGGDWLLIASAVFLGKALTLEHISVNRDFNKDSYKEGHRTLAKINNLPVFQGENPHLSTSISAFNDIAWISSAYESLGTFGRVVLGWEVQKIICQRYKINLDNNLLLLLNYLERHQREPFNPVFLSDLKNLQKQIANSQIKGLADKFLSQQIAAIEILNLDQFIFEITAGIEQYQKNLADSSAIEKIRQYRKQLANYWIDLPSDQFENAYLGEAGKAHILLTNSGIKDCMDFDGENKKMSDISQKQVVILDYPVNCRPRYGMGKLPHQKLYEIISENSNLYEGYLKKFLSYREFLIQIPLEADGEAFKPYWFNGWFSGIDAVALYGFLAMNNPKKFFEIGSGNSTKFAKKAINDHKLQTYITSIDPYPRSEIDLICDFSVRHPLEEIDVSIFNQLDEGDILFVDNSHRVFMNSDVTALFLDILPILKKGVWVEFHDIFLPYDYPLEWKDRYYSEQYMLAVYILSKVNCEIIFPSAFISADSYLSTILNPLWLDVHIETAMQGGGSFWIKIK